MALPSMRDKYIREQVVEAMALADVAKGPVAMAWRLTETLPEDNAGAGLPDAQKIVGNFVQSVTVEHGAIHVMFGNRANGAIQGRVLSLRPAVVEDEPMVPVAWVCGHAPPPTPMVVLADNRTDLPKPLLPINCR